MNPVKKIRFFLEYLLVASVMKIVGALPHTSLQKTARFFTVLMEKLPGTGGLCRMNIATAFPEKSREEVNHIARKSLENLVLTLLEFLWIRKHPEKLEELIDTSLLDACAREGQEKRSSGNGVIFITPHLGNWEFSGRLLAQLYHFPMATIVRKARNPYLDELVSSGRKGEDSVEIIHSEGAARGMNRALQNGKCIGILIDQNTKGRDGGIFVNLFGMPVPMSRAPAVLGRKKNCFIAIGTTLRKEDGKFYSILRKLPKDAAACESDEELIQLIADEMEKLIRLAPEQYLWLYKRFQYIPEGTPEEIRKRFPPYAKTPSTGFYSNKDRGK